MLEIYQQTIEKPLSFKGVGLHNGKKTKITIFPGKEDQGIIFKRTDLKNDNEILASYKNVTSAKLSTTLANEKGVKVSTVEHLLASLYLAEIDNAIIEVDNEEIPIMDGSAKDFLNSLKKTKIKRLNKKRKYLRVTERVAHNFGEKKISIEPNGSSFEVNFQLNYKNKIIGKQSNIVNFQKDDLKNVCESRTFCLFEDIENIKKMGLAKGGSLENAIVVDDDKILNKDGLRNEKEFVNHKILDLAGDFLLSGFRVLGKVECQQGGHELTNKFLRKLFKSKSSFVCSELEDIIITKKVSSNQPLRVAVNA